MNISADHPTCKCGAKVRMLRGVIKDCYKCRMLKKVGTRVHHCHTKISEMGIKSFKIKTRKERGVHDEQERKD